MQIASIHEDVLKSNWEMELKGKFIAKNLKYMHSIFITCISLAFWKLIIEDNTFNQEQYSIPCTVLI